jgi:hypothetical protein
LTRFLIDTNVLILLLLGRADPANFGKHKRLDIFVLDDLKNLEAILRDATGFVTLPYILAQCSDLMKIGDRAPSAVVQMYEKFVMQAEEIDCRSKDIIESQYFRRLGLTDAAIIQLVRDRVHVVTVDYELFGVLCDRGVIATNLRHMTKLR